MCQKARLEILPVLARRHALSLFEGLCKHAVVRVAGSLRHLADRKVGGDEQLLRPLHANVREIAQEVHADLIFRVYLKTHDVTGSEGFLRCARHFFAGILTYFKEK